MGRKSDSIEWSKDPETFNFLGKAWDVGKAKDIIRTKKPRKIEEVDIEGAATLLRKVLKTEDGRTMITMGVAVDWDRVRTEEVNLDIPIILVHFQDSYLPIDGWHRIAKAKLEGRTSIPCVVLNKTESKQVSL